MGFKKVIEVKGGFNAEYWNMGRVADIIRTTDDNDVEIERADIHMRCYKDRQAYLDGAKHIEEKRVSVEFPYDSKVSRNDYYSLIKNQVDFFEDAEDVIE